MTSSFFQNKTLPKSCLRKTPSNGNITFSEKLDKIININCDCVSIDDMCVSCSHVFITKKGWEEIKKRVYVSYISMLLLKKNSLNEDTTEENSWIEKDFDIFDFIDYDFFYKTIKSKDEINHVIKNIADIYF